MDYNSRLYKDKLFRRPLSLERRLLNYYLRSLNLQNLNLLQLRTPYGTILGFDDEGTLYCANEIFMKKVYDKFWPIKKDPSLM